jgi:hypothetical protein
MKKLGILTNQIATNQKLISISHNLNKLSITDRNIDCILFYNDMGALTVKKEFACMSSVSALSYDGILIATDMVSACLLNKCLRASDKYFYVWDIDWHKLKKPIEFMKNIYFNNDIELIARSEHHAKLITKVFKKPKYIIEEHNHEQWQRLVYS